MGTSNMGVDDGGKESHMGCRQPWPKSTILFYSFVLSGVALAGLSALGTLMWTRGREAYQTTKYGLPFPWLSTSEPNRMVARLHPETIYDFDSAFLFLDWCIWFSVVLIVLWLYHRRRWIALRLQCRCSSCGYPLYGLPEPRCPECGTMFDPKLWRELKHPPSRRDVSGQ